MTLPQYIYNENDTDTKLIVKRLKEYAVALASKIENKLVSVKELEEMIVDVYHFEKRLKEVRLFFTVLTRYGLYNSADRLYLLNAIKDTGINSDFSIGNVSWKIGIRALRS